MFQTGSDFGDMREGGGGGIIVRGGGRVDGDSIAESGGIVSVGSIDVRVGEGR